MHGASKENLHDARKVYILSKTKKTTLEVTTCRKLSLKVLGVMLKEDPKTKYIDAKQALEWYKDAVEKQRAQ